METIGIIAEYNPFHNGHRYQIEEIKKRTGAKNIVIVMSGNFVQRGLPAWTDKYLRTHMALSCGADFVFELPVCYSTASAGLFAHAGVSLLHSLGFVDGICFGCECTDLPLLSEIADFLANPCTDFDRTVKKLVSEGINYPAARAEALCRQIFASAKQIPAATAQSGLFKAAPANQAQNEYSKEVPAATTQNGLFKAASAYSREALLTVLSSPNTILAIEYLKALRRQNSPLIPLPVGRCDNGYHSTETKAAFSSSAAIRQKSLTAMQEAGFSGKSGNKKAGQIEKGLPAAHEIIKAIAPAMPEAAVSLLTGNTGTFPVTEDAFSDVLYYRLCQRNERDGEILDMTTELLNRIYNIYDDFKTFSVFLSELKTKQYTYSRCSRAVLHLLLNIYKTDVLCQQAEKPQPENRFPDIPYARLLGFRRQKSHLLRQITQLPVITKPADGIRDIHRFYTEAYRSSNCKETGSAYAPQANAFTDYLHYADRLYQKDIFAANLYAQVQSRLAGTLSVSEWRQGPVILP